MKGTYDMFVQKTVAISVWDAVWHTAGHRFDETLDAVLRLDDAKPYPLSSGKYTGQCPCAQRNPLGAP
jgi:hypothetical protein